MKAFYRRVFSYTMENKKEVLPQVFIFYIMSVLAFSTTFLPTNVWTIVNILIGFPIFIWSFFRTLGKMERDNMSYWDRVFVVIILPFLLICSPFVLGLIFALIYGLLFKPI